MLFKIILEQLLKSSAKMKNTKNNNKQTKKTNKHNKTTKRCLFIQTDTHTLVFNLFERY